MTETVAVHRDGDLVTHVKHKSRTLAAETRMVASVLSGTLTHVKHDGGAVPVLFHVKRAAEFS